MSFESLQEIKRNFLLTFLRQFVGFFLSILSSVLLARYLKEDGFGEYTLILVYTNLIVQLISFGVNTSNAYFLAKKIPVSKIFANSITFSIGISFLIAFPQYYLLDSFTELGHYELIACLIIVPVLLLNLILNSIFQGLQDFKRFNISMFLFTVVSILSQLFVIFFNGDLFDFIIAFIVSNIFSILLSFLLIKKYAFFNYKLFDFNLFRKQVSFGIKNYLSNILTFINYRGDMIIMEKFLSPKEVGIYNVSVTIAEKLWMISTTLSVTLYPKLSEISDKKEESRLIVITLSKLTLLINLLACVLIYLIAENVIIKLYGEEYRESVVALFMLLPGICATSVARLLSNYISSINKPLHNFYVSVFTVLLNIILNIILIPKYFILGAAFTTSLVYILNLIIKSIIFYKFSKTTFKEVIWNNVDSGLLKILRW